MVQISFLALIKLAQIYFDGKPVLVAGGFTGGTIFLHTEKSPKNIVYDIIEQKIIGGNHEIDDLIMQIILTSDCEKKQEKSLFSEEQYMKEKGEKCDQGLLEFKQA